MRALIIAAALIAPPAWAQTGLPSPPAVVVQVQGAPGPQGPPGATPSAASLGCASGACADAATLSAVQAAMPTPYGSIPPGPTPSGSAGSGNSFLPGNATQITQSRSTTVTTNSSGAFSVTWTVPLNSATPVVNLIPVNPSSTTATICNVSVRSASAVSGQCWTISPTTLSLSIVTAGLVVGPSAAASGIPVMVFAREPTQ